MRLLWCEDTGRDSDWSVFDAHITVALMRTPRLELWILKDSLLGFIIECLLFYVRRYFPLYYFLHRDLSTIFVFISKLPADKDTDLFISCCYWGAGRYQHSQMHFINIVQTGIHCWSLWRRVLHRTIQKSKQEHSHLCWCLLVTLVVPSPTPYKDCAVQWVVCGGCGW